MKGYQLWIALPSHEENSKPSSAYLSASQVPREGPARIILGEYKSAKSLIPATSNMNYLDIRLADRETWSYETPTLHDVAFIAIWKGKIKTSAGEIINAGELAVFEESQGGTLSFEAIGDTGFMLGSAVKHPHDLVLGRYSVHTSPAKLKLGEEEIQRIGTELKRKGVF